MASLGIAVLGPTWEVKVEVCGWEGKQQPLIYQYSQDRVSIQIQATLSSSSRLPRHPPSKDS